MPPFNLSSTVSGGPLYRHMCLTSFQDCNICSISKTSHQRPVGLLQLLAIPQQPSSHITIDSITDLPDSHNYTTILTVIDRFSKACCLIPLTKLPTAFETFEALLNQEFWFYGLPEDIVIVINISLTSRYHPESIGQVERLNQKQTIPLLILPQQAIGLELLPVMGRIRPELASQTIHWTYPLSVCARFSTF